MRKAHGQKNADRGYPASMTCGTTRISTGLSRIKGRFAISLARLLMFVLFFKPLNIAVHISHAMGHPASLQPS